MKLNPKIILKNIRFERLRKGYSQEVMAEMLGISQNAYSKMERGKTKLSISRLQNITHILGVSVEHLSYSKGLI